MIFGFRFGILFLCAFLITPSWKTAAQARLQNVQSEQRRDQIFITYDLIGDPDESYEVAVYASLNRGRTFDVRPEAVRGSVGKGVSSGRGKQITWDLRQEYPDGPAFDENDLRVKLTVSSQGLGALWPISGTSGWALLGEWTGLNVGSDGIDSRDVAKQAKLGYAWDGVSLLLVAEQSRPFRIASTYGQASNVRFGDFDVYSVGPEFGIQVVEQQGTWPFTLDTSVRYQYTWGSGQTFNGRGPVTVSYSAHRGIIESRLYHSISMNSSFRIVPQIRYVPLRGQLESTEFDDRDTTSRTWMVQSDTAIFPGLGVSIGSKVGLFFSVELPVRWVRDNFQDSVQLQWQFPILNGGIHF